MSVLSALLEGRDNDENPNSGRCSAGIEESSVRNLIALFPRDGVIDEMAMLQRMREGRQEALKQRLLTINQTKPRTNTSDLSEEVLRRAYTNFASLVTNENL